MVFASSFFIDDDIYLQFYVLELLLDINSAPADVTKDLLFYPPLFYNVYLTSLFIILFPFAPLEFTFSGNFAFLSTDVG